MTPEELARDHPALLPELREAIAALKATAWLDRPVIARVLSDDRLPTTRFGDYELLDLIGSGGMGRVYKARHQRMDRVVAVKLLPRSFAIDPAAKGRFAAEVRAAARLAHPHVVAAFDAGEQDGISYLVMEYVEGLNLRDLVERDGPLSVVTAVEYARQVALGLGFGHRMGVVHRDVKPSNLLLAADGTVKVADLGLAQFKGSPAETVPAPVVGTADYVAPEQAGGVADHRADIYALGGTLFYLLTGRPPFTGSIPEVIQAHRNAPAPSLREVRPDVPPTLDALFQKLIAKNPADRPQSMDAVIVALDSVRTAGHYRRWPLSLAVVAVAAVLIYLGLRWWPGDRPGSMPPGSDVTVAPLAGHVEPSPRIVPPHAPRPDDNRPLAEKAKRLNDLTTWRVENGRWTQTSAGIVGSGDSYLIWGERLPCPVVLEFDMTVMKGMRPRVHFGGTDLFIANEGYSSTIGLYARDQRHQKEIRGDRLPYKVGEKLAVRVVFSNDTVTLWVNGREQQSARYTPPPYIGLSIQGGDGWSPGETVFGNFRVSKPVAPLSVDE